MGKSKKVFGEPPAQPPMSSMIDVVFLLLIYFIATQKEVIPEAHMAVNLPAPTLTTAEIPDVPPQNIEVKVTSYNYQYMNNPMPLEQIREALIQRGASNSKYIVVIKVTLGANAQQLVNMLDACKIAGLDSLNIVPTFK